MKNAGIILVSGGVLLIGFSLLTPLLFFLIEVCLDNSADGSILLQMEHAALSCIGLGLLILGSLFFRRKSLTIILSSVVAVLVIVVSYLTSVPAGFFGWIVTGGYYLALFTAFSAGIMLLHAQRPYQ